MVANIEQLKNDLKKEVNERRYNHSIGVAQTAVELAKIYNADPFKAEIAGILHDYTKNWSIEELEKYIRTYNQLSDELLLYGHELYHGPVASIVVQNKYDINDEDIINAIRYHTSGREQMSLLEKIICLADYIEPSRRYTGVDKLRELAKKDINQALLEGFNGTIIHLIKENKKIYPLTIKTRNYMIEELNQNFKGGK